MDNTEDKFEILTKEQFKKWSPFYDSKPVRLLYFERIYQRIIQTIIEEAGTNLQNKKLKFLDVACGTGEVISRLAKKFPQVEFVGVDFSEEMLGQAIEKTKRLTNMKILQTNIRVLPFPDNSFDIILCSDAFHHFASPEESLKEMDRVTKTGGSLFLIDPAFDTIFQKIVIGLFGKIFETVKKYYSKKEIDKLLKTTDFTIKSSFTYYFTNFFACRKL